VVIIIIIITMLTTTQLFHNLVFSLINVYQYSCGNIGHFSEPPVWF